MIDDLFVVTHFFHHGARHKSEVQYSLESLAQTIEAKDAEAKDLLPWVKLARFGNNPTDKGSLRHDANVIAITGCEGDYDQEQVSFDQAVQLLRKSNIGCIVHTSPSHQAAKPRWRVLCPYSKEYPPDDRARFVARLNGVLGGVLGPESFTLSQSYLYGHLDNGAEFRVEALEGRHIDLCDDLDAGAIGKSGSKPGTGNGHRDHRDHPDIEELTRRILAGEVLHPSVGPIAGSYAARVPQVPLDACLDYIALAFTAAHQPRYGGRWDEVETYVRWVYAKEEAKQKPPPASPLPLANLALDGVEVPQPEWAVFNRIGMRQVCLFGGHGATGKSTIALHLACAHVLGRDWLKALASMGGCLFIDCEDDWNAIWFRLDAIRKFYGVKYLDLLDGGLEILPMSGLDCVMATVNPKSGVVTPTAFYAQVLERAGDLKFVNIVIANSANVFAGNENDRSQVQQFIGLLKRIANASGGSVTLISHASLTGLSTETGLSGSTQWHNAVRARMWLRTPKANGADKQPDNDLRVLDFMKNQYGRADESVVLRWKNGLYLPETIPTGYELAARLAEVETAFVAILTRFTAAKRRVSPNPCSTYAPKAFEGEAEAVAAKATRKELADAMGRLLDSSRIKIAEWGYASHKRQYLDLP